MQVLGVIPARGGSKGIPNKNLALVGGRPLLAYTVDAVRQSARLTRAVVSTNDEGIADTARALGLEVPFLRPSSLANDDTPLLPVLQHAMHAMAADGFHADVIVLLQPTSPLRRGEHIDAAIDWLQRAGGDSVVSVVEVPHQFNPASVLRFDEGWLFPFLDGPAAARRQDKPRLYARNGPAVLAVRASVIAGGSLYGRKSWPLVMKPEESVDVDTPWDLSLVEWALSVRGEGPPRQGGMEQLLASVSAGLSVDADPLPARLRVSARRCRPAAAGQLLQEPDREAHAPDRRTGGAVRTHSRGVADAPRVSDLRQHR